MKLVTVPVRAQSTLNNLCRHTLFSPEHKGAAAPEEQCFVLQRNRVLFLMGKRPSSEAKGSNLTGPLIQLLFGRITQF